MSNETEIEIGGFAVGEQVRILQNAGEHDGETGVVATLDHDHGWRLWVRLGADVDDKRQVALYCDPDDLDHVEAEPEQRTTLTIPGDPKAIREALCVAEGATLRNVDEEDWHGAREVLGALIQECDRHRPLGPDGKHGNHHTATCGCDDVPERHQVALPTDSTR